MKNLLTHVKKNKIICTGVLIVLLMLIACKTSQVKQKPKPKQILKPALIKKAVEESGAKTIKVKKGQTLNQAIADVKGPVYVILPEGITEHDKAITRNETIIIQGQGEKQSTLKPSENLGPDDGIGLVTQTKGYEGDFIIADLTYDRNFHPGCTPENQYIKTGANIFTVSAKIRVEFRNVTIHHFDFGAREGERNANCPFSFTKIIMRNRKKGVYKYHTKELLFKNVTIDFKKNGGIRHRPGGHHKSFEFGTVDKLEIDKDCLFVGHLCQNADPKNTVGKVWRNRGNAGPLYGMLLYVYEEAYIDGVWSNSDYGAWRNGGVVTEDAVVEWRMDLLNAGYADQFWHRPFYYGTPEEPVDGQAGHMIFKDVLQTSHNTDALWHDYGLRTGGDWKSITVKDCKLIGRGHPLSFIWASNQGHITVSNVTIVARRKPALQIIAHNIEGLEIDGLKVSVHPDSKGGYTKAIEIIEDGKGGGQFTIKNVQAEGYVEQLLNDETGENTTIDKINVRGQKAEITVPEGAALGMIPKNLSHPHKPRPPWHTSKEKPGVYMPLNYVFSVARGKPTVQKKGIATMSYTREAFHLFLEVRGDDVSTVKDGVLENADRVRIGLALGKPGDVDTWYEVEVAASEGEKPIERTRVQIRQYPGGEVIEPETPIKAGRTNPKKDKYDRMRWGILIPWAAVDINPNDEMFWVKRELSVDLAYIDVDDGKESGVFQFMGKSGILEQKTPEKFKYAALMFIPWGEK